MAPILIDSRDLLKLGFISVLTAFFVFSAGFLFGHQKAASFYMTGSQLEHLFLPEKVASVESDVEPQMPEIIDAGEEIDVDQPALESKVMTHIASEESESNAPENAEDEANADTSTTLVQQHQAILASSFTPDEINKIKYSIQVGMYGRLINAENMMQMLQAQQLNAYVSDYTNKKDEVRYNVRFGYFTDKETALSALKTYKNNRNGDGYLVKFSVENIINIARAANRELPDITEEKNEGLTPVTKPSEVMPASNSAVDTVSAADILMKAHV